MTEPEELDEDLFADLWVSLCCTTSLLLHADTADNLPISLTRSRSYDGDEIAMKLPPPAAVQAIPEAPVVSGLTDHDMHLDDSASRVKEEIKQEDFEQKVQTTGETGNEVGGLEWQNGHPNGGGANDYGDMTIEPESHGPGIKEDG